MGIIGKSYSVRAEDFDVVGSAWEELLPSCFTDTIFVTHSWQRLWWRRFGNGFRLRLLSVRDGDRTVGIAPLMLRDGVMSFVGDDDLFDYQDFLVVRGDEAEFYGVLWDHLLTEEWSRLELTSVPEGSPTLEFLPRLAERDGIAVELVAQAKTPVALLPSTWDEYVAGLGKKARHELRRKLRRLEETGSLKEYLCGDRDELQGCLDEFFRLLRASSADKRRFLTPEREEFFVDLVSEFATRGESKLYFLELGGVRVAACLCFDYRGSYLLYNSGYDPSCASLSVGLVNKALSIKDAIEEGRSSFNFLKGTERYKYELGGKDRAVFRLVAHR